MKEVNRIKLPFARSGWWEHGGRGSYTGAGPATLETDWNNQHRDCTAQHLSAESRTKTKEQKLLTERGLGFLKLQLLPIIFWPQQVLCGTQAGA